MYLRRLLEIMVERGASDLYLSAGSVPRVRVNRTVLPADDKLLEPADTEEMAFGVMDRQQRSEFSRTNEMNLAFFVDKVGRFRTNVFRQRGSIGIVIRHVKLKIPSIEDLQHLVHV